MLNDWELRDLYRSSSIASIAKSRNIRKTARVVRMGDIRNANRIVTEKPLGKRPLGSPRLGSGWN